MAERLRQVPDPALPTASAPSYAPVDVDTALIAGLTEDGRATHTDLARRAALTARRRLEALLESQVLRLATGLDLALLGAQAEAQLRLCEHCRLSRKPLHADGRSAAGASVQRMSRDGTGTADAVLRCVRLAGLP